MQFRSLRLGGFKSFVDETELTIDEGLTGVVGPNGCGKSNLLEALRWVMGENSPRSMRGKGMEDVIFAGTDARPARNLAHVTLSLDNAAKQAPPPFNTADTLEITRRIERDRGSDYRINGRPVRARDVQILFADAATGAQSPSIVSQGRVSAMIQAKPAERRLVLEEAAGIAGLHARRHEAELKLRGAETNLARLEDLLRQMAGQLSTLQRQAKQAARYRQLSELVRMAQARVFLAALAGIEGRDRAARAAFKAIDAEVARLMAEVAAATRSRTETAAELPQLRNQAVAAAATLQRLKAEREAIDAAERRHEQAVADIARQIRHARDDILREETARQQAEERLTAIRSEQDALNGTDHQARLAALEAEAQSRQQACQTAEQAVSDAEAARAEAEALHRAALKDRQRLTSALEASQSRLRSLAEQLSGLSPEALEKEVEAARTSGAEARAELDRQTARLATARERAEQARTDAATAREKLSGERETIGSLEAEARGLRAATQGPDEQAFPPILDAISVTQGFEPALAAALGDDAGASLDPAAPHRWAGADLPTDLAPPAGTIALTDQVSGPAEIARRLAGIGIADEAEAKTRFAALLPGQALVTSAGRLYRWDGIIRDAEASQSVAAGLAQRNRLAALEAELATRQPGLAALETAASEARQRAETATEALNQAVCAQQTAQRALEGAERRVGDAAAALARLEARCADLQSRHDELVGETQALSAALAALPGPQAADQEGDGHGERVAAARADLARARQARDAASEQLSALRREADRQAAERAALDRETASVSERLSQSDARIIALRARLDPLIERDEALAQEPIDFSDRRDRLGEALLEAERSLARANDALASAEERDRQADRERHSAEAALADARETRARHETEIASLGRESAALAERIGQTLQIEPNDLAGLAELSPADPIPDAASAQAHLDKLLRERDNVGAVNLRAEEEADELAMQIAGLEAEKADLEAAIAKLRQAIATINRDARGRLSAAFNSVNAHFEKLFTRLFGGGSARLEMIESDDPLEAGLEIFASPPGKKPAVLSLLSGGEQALTAIALLFAMFLTNPSPICVLDEVDAPLDDANVDRFCTLLDELAHGTETRFLVITHHRLTMARMDRLYGVTMAERGVSKLVSVDLTRAERLRDEPARVAMAG